MFLSLYHHGTFLSSRLMGRNIFSLIENEVKISKSITLDFMNVKNMTMSFGTELIDSIKKANAYIEINIINASDFVRNIINFCLANSKQELEVIA